MRYATVHRKHKKYRIRKNSFLDKAIPIVNISGFLAFLAILNGLIENIPV